MPGSFGGLNSGSGGGRGSGSGGSGSSSHGDYTSEELGEAQREYRNRLEEYNRMQARSRLHEAIATNPVAQYIAKVESFLFTDLPLTVTGVGVYTAAGRIGTTLF